MPELPEVEIVTRHLGRLVTGRRIRSAQLIRSKLAPLSSPSEFAEHLAGALVTRVHRRGKHILLGLDNERTLIVHLRMSGRFVLQDIEIASPKFSHAQFEMDNDLVLHFSDQRHFGMMKIVETNLLFQAKELASLAPEPFSEEFSSAYLRRTLKDTSRNIKETLIDQTKVCGLGNIYVSEALFLAGIDPRIRANRLSGRRTDVLHSAIRDVLTESLALGDTVPILPKNIGGNFYGNEALGDWRVYGREGEHCVICGTGISRIVQGGRSTFFCRNCQKR